MPLKEGKSKETFSKNVAEILRAYKKKGKIGKVTPKSKKKARQIALAIAFSKKEGK